MKNNKQELFATEVNEKKGIKTLSGTAQLTSISSSIAQGIISVITAQPEEHMEIFEASKETHDAMDMLVANLQDLTEVDVQFLKELSEDELERMLKSQQSKRSRSKGKAMTLDNYRDLMSASIAEALLRIAMDKPKHAAGARRVSGAIEYSAEEIEMYAADQELLRRELRNAQSKKSIHLRKMRGTEEYNEAEDEMLARLIAAEDQLKAVRTAIDPAARRRAVDKTGEALKRALGDKSIADLKAAEARDLLEKLLAGTTPDKSEAVVEEPEQVEDTQESKAG